MLFYNGNWIENRTLQDNDFAEYFTIYEVIRIFRGAPVFIQDNVERLHSSIKKSEINIDCNILDLRVRALAFVAKCNIIEGNIKYLLVVKDRGNSGHSAEYDEYMVQIPHRYPTEAEYAAGVPTSVVHTERINPEIKYLNVKLREWTTKIIAERNVYELLLVNANGEVTEGSKSNIFFIKDDTLYTSPDNMVLGGTARKRVIALAEKLGIMVIKQAPLYLELDCYDSAFITGTSPMVLPISQIDSIKFNVGNSTLRTIMSSYFKMVTE